MESGKLHKEKEEEGLPTTIQSTKRRRHESNNVDAEFCFNDSNDSISLHSDSAVKEVNYTTSSRSPHTSMTNGPTTPTRTRTQFQNVLLEEVRPSQSTSPSISIFHPLQSPTPTPTSTHFSSSMPVSTSPQQLHSSASISESSSSPNRFETHGNLNSNAFNFVHPNFNYSSTPLNLENSFTPSSNVMEFMKQNLQPFSNIKDSWNSLPIAYPLTPELLQIHLLQQHQQFQRQSIGYLPSPSIFYPTMMPQSFETLNALNSLSTPILFQQPSLPSEIESNPMGTSISSRFVIQQQPSSKQRKS